MITYTIETRGLVFKADAESRQELKDHADNYQKQLIVVFYYVLGNGLETVDPADIGALTDSEIFSADVSRNDAGEVTQCGDVFWFPNYCITNPWETLAETGEVIFTKGE